MHLDTLLHQYRTTDNYVFPTNWGQGRATFGGLIAALLHEAMAKAVPDQRQATVFNLQFIAPAMFGDVQIKVDQLRVGKSVSHLQATALQEGKPVATALASFTNQRESSLHCDGPAAPVIATPDTTPPGYERSGPVPDFIKQFDHRWVLGEAPFMASSEKAIGGWIRVRDSNTDISEGHVLAMIDAWPPAALSMLSMPAPASTLNWTIRWADHPMGFQTSEFCQFHTEMDCASHGIAHSRSFFWGPDGKLIAISEQTDTIFG